MRDNFGLRTDILGPHWPGTGPDAEEYCETSNTFRKRAKHHKIIGNVPSGECCVLLTKPVAAVRGFLALARREAEAGWCVTITSLPG